MDNEFHYYITYYLARKAGFSENDSYVLAYACQMTDDNNCVFTVRGKDEVFENYISQTLNITKPQHKLMRIYLCFHFIPGDYLDKSAYRRDGKLHLLNTTPGSENSSTLLDRALATGNLYRIGIALHAYGDSWAHQNFIGDNDTFNRCDGFFAWLIPDIGHADFITKPDMMSLYWEDKRLIPSQCKINNQERMIGAAKNIYRKLRQYKHPGITAQALEKEWADAEQKLLNAAGPVYKIEENNRQYTQQRLEAYAELLQPGYVKYDPCLWFDEAVHTRVRGFKDKPLKLGKSSLIPDIHTMKPDFMQSHWYGFQAAVKEHQNLAREIILPRIEKMEFNKF